MNREQAYEIIKSEIDQISHLELRRAISLMLSRTNASAAENVNPAIERELEFWKGNSFVGEGFAREAKIRATCNFFYNHFRAEPYNLDVPALQGNQPFANNQIGLLDNPTEVRHTMLMYCEYLMILSTKPKEVQQAFLHSFPPADSNFLQCSGGSRTRISENLTQLKVSDLDRYMFDAHSNSSSNIQGKLKPKIHAGNHIHLVPYINYALSTESAETLRERDNYYLTPQFGTASTDLFQQLRDYDKIFKELLLKDEEFISYVTSQIGKKMAVINAVIETAKANGVEIDANSLTLKASSYRDFIIVGTKAGNIGELVEYSDKTGEFKWSEEKILRLAAKEFLANFFTKEKTLEEQRPNQISIDAISQEAGLFSCKTSDHLVKLLKSNDLEEVTIGVEALWTLAERMVSNSKLQVVRTVNALGGEQVLANIKSGLKQYPNYQHKVGRIKENFDVYVGNPAVIACLASTPEQEQQISLGILVSTGATTEEIIQYCDRTAVERLRHDLTQPITEDDGSTKTVTAKMEQRPDCANILGKLEELEFASRPLSVFLATNPNQQRFLNYISKRSEADLKQDFQNTFAGPASLAKLLNNFDALKILKEKAVAFTPSLQIQILEDFRENQSGDEESEVEKIVYFLKHFLTGGVTSQSLSRMPHAQRLIAKLKEPDDQARATPFRQMHRQQEEIFSKLLSDLASSGNVEEKADDIKLLAALGLDLDIVGSRAAHIAVKEGHLNVLKLLAECGATLDTKNRFNKRPIHAAIQEGNAEIFNYLLERNIRTKENGSLLYDYLQRPMVTTVVAIDLTAGILPYALLVMPSSFCRVAFSPDPRREMDNLCKDVKAISVDRINAVTSKSDPLLTVEAARYGRADFLKTLLELGLETPFVPEVRNPEIRKILDAGERAAEIAKSMISVIKTSPEVLMNKEALKAMEASIRVTLLKEYEFDAVKMARDFRLKSKTLFEGLTPHFFRRNIGHTTAANEFVKSTANGFVRRLRDSGEIEELTDILSEELKKGRALDTAITNAPSAKPSPVAIPSPLANHTATRSLS